MTDKASPALPASRIGKAIGEANARGRLGLVLCLIPGFPDLDTYREIRAFLEAREAVTALEVTYPASRTFSETINDTIVRANLRAVEVALEVDLSSLLRTNKTSFLQYYREAVERYGFEALVSQHRGLCDGVMLEWREKETGPYHESCRRQQVELVQCVPVGTPAAEVERTLELVFPNGLVYVSCASQAGGARPPASEIRETVELVERRRPDTVVAAAMGIRSPEDVAAMGALPGIDAVVMGTAFMRAEEQGLPGVERFIEAIEPALALSRGRQS